MLIETNQYVATTLATYIFSSIMVARASDDPVERGDDGIVWHGLKQEDPILMCHFFGLLVHALSVRLQIN